MTMSKILMANTILCPTSQAVASCCFAVYLVNKSKSTSQAVARRKSSLSGFSVFSLLSRSPAAWSRWWSWWSSSHSCSRRISWEITCKILWGSLSCWILTMTSNAIKNHLMETMEKVVICIKTSKWQTYLIVETFLRVRPKHSVGFSTSCVPAHQDWHQ